MADDELTIWQRMGMRKLRKDSGRGPDEPLQTEDWSAYYAMENSVMMHVLRGFWRALPSSPRCGRCGAPFAGVGRFVASPLGYKPSRKNPTVCAACVETSPPGGMTMRAGILFADIRGFTSRSESSDPEAMSLILRRFYRCAEDVLFPDAIIDKLIGDEVMALYLPDVLRNVEPEHVSELMLDHARGLLEAVGYGSEDGPFVEMGVGMDIGQAFVGNIGERALYDFTAVGDVVNTASRLQARRPAARSSSPTGSPRDCRNRSAPAWSSS